MKTPPRARVKAKDRTTQSAAPATIMEARRGFMGSA
jgi:hypothetical protein